MGGDILFKMTSDWDLLLQFTREHSQDAFREIVRRHLNLVYSAALRQARSPQLAEEIAQSVFADLAVAAGGLKSGTILAAWLYAVASRTAVDMVRKESRRQMREQIAVEMNTVNATADDWTQIAPLLDEAMAALDETDRTAVLLRYFENQSLREVGSNLGISDDAAQKRVSRAVERLREFFSKRKLTVGAAGLAALISANSVQSAPIGLAAIISSTVLAGTAQTSALIAATKTIAMTTLQKSIIVAALASVAGTGLYAAHQNAQLRGQIEKLQRQQAPLAEQVQRLAESLANATNENAALKTENERLRSDAAELLRLRGEVAASHGNSVVQSKMENPEAPSKANPSAAEDIGRELGNAVVRGDPGAMNKIADLAKSELEDFNTNSAGLDDTHRGDMARQEFAPLRDAFGIIADAASQKNQFAITAIAQAAQIPELNGLAVQALGTLAANGNDGALDCLLDYQSYGFSLSSVVGALQPAANAGNQKAIDALAAVSRDSNQQPLWFMVAIGLQTAAASGNSVAVDSLCGLLAAQDQNVRNAAISGLKAAAANHNARAIEALHSLNSQTPN